MRIVSLLPSGTEIVAALGHEAALVGRSAECDFPRAILDRAVVMRPRVYDFDQPSAAIDRRVREARGRGESLYVLDVHALATLRPDMLITQDLCGVCSVTGPEVEAACRTAGVDPTIVSLTPRNLPDVWENIRSVGKALNDGAGAERLAHSLERRCRPRTSWGARPRVAVVEWLDPPILAGLWVADQVDSAGGQSLGPPSGSPGVGTDWDRLLTLKPELLVLAPCSFSVDRTRREIDHSGLDASLRRFEAPRGIWVVDEAYFSRPGPRLIDGIELLRSKLWAEPFTPPMPARPWGLPGA